MEAVVWKWGQGGTAEELRSGSGQSDPVEAWPHPPFNYGGVSFQIEFTPEQIEGEWES